MTGPFRNRKNGHVYNVIGIAIDATNEKRSSGRMVVYESESGDLYVRDYTEFIDIFDAVPTGRWEP